MTVIEQHEYNFHGVAWHVVEEFRHFEILRKRCPVKKDHLGLKALHVKHEPQYRIRTKKGKNRFILFQSGALGEVYSYLSSLEKAVGEADPTHWSVDTWEKLIRSVELPNGEKALAAQPVRRETMFGDSKFRPSVLQKENFVHHGLQGSQLASPVGSPMSSSAAGSLGGALSGKFLRSIEMQASEVAALMDWSNSGITIASLLVIVLSWVRGVALELLCVSLLWWLAAVVDKTREVQEEEGDYALERALEWVDRQVACLLQPSRIPLAWRLLAVPILCFTLFQIFNPPGFRLFILLLPFLASTTHAFCPMFYFLFQPKTWLWIPHSDALPPSAIPRHQGRPSMGPRSPLQAPAAEPPLSFAHPASDTSSASSQASSLSDGEPQPAISEIPSGLLSTSVKVPSLPRAVVKMLDLHLADGWELYRRDRDMVVDSKAVPWCETAAFRLTTVFNCSLEAFGQFMCLTENVFKSDQLIEKRIAIEEIDKHTTIFHSTYKSPMIGVSKRDALLEMTRMYITAEEAQRLGLPAKKTFVEASFSCDHPACPLARGYIRTKVFCAGYLAQEDGPHRITLINIGSASPEGWIPSKVVEAVGSKLTVKIEKLRQCIEASTSNAAA